MTTHWLKNPSDGFGPPSPSMARPRILLQHKMLLWLLVFVAVPTFACVWWVSNMTGHAMSRHHSRNVALLTHALAASLATHSDGMNAAVVESKLRVLNIDQRLSFVSVTDPSHHLLFRHALDAQAWVTYQQWRDAAGHAAIVDVGAPVILGRTGDLAVHRVPIWDPPLVFSSQMITGLPMKESRRLLGYITIGMNEPGLSQSLSELWVAQFTGAAVICLLLLPVAVLLVRKTVQPLVQLFNASLALAEGEVPLPVSVNRQDEIGLLADAFNYMTVKLTTARELQHHAQEELERKVALRTKELEHLNEQLERTARQFETLAATDPLTSVANRRAIGDALQHAYYDAKRWKSDLACVMLDIDGFKQLNDTLGHLMGDQVLQQTARALTRASRGGDVAGRYGGDEFVLLLPRADEEAAIAVAIRLGELFTREMQTLLGDTVMNNKVTMSMGVAIMSQANVRDSEQLLAKADHALYRAKKTGKNKIVIYNAAEGQESTIEIISTNSSASPW